MTSAPPDRRHGITTGLDDGGVRLQLVVQALAASHDLDEALAIVVNQSLAGLGADGAVVGLLNDDDQLHIVASHGLDPATTQVFDPMAITVALPITDCVRKREPVWLTTLAERDERYPVLAGHYVTAQASASIPLIVGGEVIGALGIVFRTPRTFAPAERTLLRSLASVCAMAVDRLYGGELGPVSAGGDTTTNPPPGPEDPTPPPETAEVVAPRPTPVSLRHLGLVSAVALPSVFTLFWAQVEEPTRYAPGAWYLLAVIIPAMLGGLAAARLASGVALFWLWWEVLEPRGELTLTLDESFALGSFVLACVALMWVFGRVERARTDATVAQAEAATADARFRDVVEVGALGVISCRGGVIHHANDAFLHLIGRTREDVGNDRFRWIDLLPESDRAASLEALEHLRTHGTTGPRERDLLAIDGRLIPVLVSSVRTAENPLQWTSFVVDLTERKTVEHRLRLSEQRYRSLVQATSSVVFTATSSGGFTVPQPSWARFVGQPDDDEAAGTWFEAVHPDDASAARSQWRAATAALAPVEIEVRVRHGASSNHRWVVVRGAPVFNEDGSVREWVATVTDVHEQHEQRSAEQRARREVMQALQTAALPGELPPVPGLEVTATYVPAQTELQVGGDWYDAFMVDDGRLVFSVGDVSGHGVEATGQMAQLRTGLRAYGLEAPDPETMLGSLNRLLCHQRTDCFATTVLAVYDPANHTLEWSHAGHPPPVRFRPGHAELLQTAECGGTVLGVWPDATYPSCSLALDEGEGLLFYTDGLVERRDEGIDVGLARLVDALAQMEASTPLPRLLADVGRLVAPDGRDDTCALVIRRGR